mmetsp:Transcript_77555/g.251072  ORF Transcript_77555/g.251072 Transcript_77555/m.251072 type:complete len:668 (-) Transcript_77555:59-2062(-)
MALQLKEIVDRLNAEPFKLDLSLVGFDDKDPFELMEVLKVVLVHLDPKHEVDLREEKPDVMYQRIAEYLHILGYQCGFDIEFQQGLISGDKSAVHPILYWLLGNLDALRKRSYLAKFCMNLDVPEEFLREEKVYEAFQQYKELQSQFKATHSHVEQERAGRMNPTDLQREVIQLDAEREQLSQKIQHLKQRSAKDQSFAVLLEVTSMLRKEQEEEARLMEKLQEQRYQLEQVEQLYIERSTRLREMREAAQADGGASAEAMLRMLRNEVTKNRQALVRVKRESDEKLQRLKDIDSALSDPPVTKSDIDDLEGHIHGMQADIQDLESKIGEHNQDSRLSVYKQQANLVSKKKEVVFKDKKQLEEERDKLSAELSVKEKEYEVTKGHKPMKRDEFKTYAASLRDKSAKFKRLKAELSELRHEVSVLVRSEQLLSAKDPTPQGLRETEEALEKASIEKSQVDKAKGKTLDEISGIVQRINSQLKEKKNKLAPQIKALRSVRQHFQQVEVKYLEKKSAYDGAKSQMDGELSKLAGDCKGLEQEVMDSEQSYHLLNMQTSTEDSKLMRAQREARCMRKEERLSPEFQTLQEQYQKQIVLFDDQCKDLRKEQKRVKETHEDDLKQKRAFMQLEALMHIKLKVSKQELQSSQYGGMLTRSMMEHTAGVERLIIE